MAAPTQAAADKNGWGVFSVQDTTSSDLYFYPFGSVWFGIGTGDPNGEVTAPKGSLFIDLGNPLLYMNTDASTTWETVAGQS